jgi:hypothetical protein
MGKEKAARSGEIKDTIIYDGMGREAHLLEGENGPMLIRDHDPTIWFISGEEYCPECHLLMERKDDYHLCGNCGHSITEEESSEGYGCPSLESTYESDFDEYFSRSNVGDAPDICDGCDGDWPDCESGCRMLRD